MALRTSRLMLLLQQPDHSQRHQADVRIEGKATPESIELRQWHAYHSYHTIDVSQLQICLLWSDRMVPGEVINNIGAFRSRHIKCISRLAVGKFVQVKGFSPSMEQIWWQSSWGTILWKFRRSFRIFVYFHCVMHM